MIPESVVTKLLDEFEPLEKELEPRHRYAPRPDVSRVLVQRKKRVAELASADLYGMASTMTGPSGHGEGGVTELVIRRSGSWGLGEYPPVFRLLPCALIYARTFGYTVVPLTLGVSE